MKLTLAELMALGLTEPQAQDILDAHKEAIDGNYEPKQRNVELRDKVKELQKKLEDAEKASAEATKLKEEVEALKQEKAKLQSDFDAQLSEAAFKREVTIALAGKVHDVDYAISLLDREKVKLNDKGKLEGLDAELKRIATEKPFLMKTDGSKPGIKITGPGTPAGGQETDPQEDESKGVKFARELAKARKDAATVAKKGSEAYFGTPSEEKK